MINFLSLYHWIQSLGKAKASLKVNWKGVLFVICSWDIPQYGGWQNWNLFQIEALSFCRLERSNKQHMWLQRQQKGWFLRDFSQNCDSEISPVISVGIVTSHSTYLKNINPFKRAQSAFWSYCWRIFSFSFSQPSKRDPLTPSCWSSQSIKPSKPTGDQQGIWQKVCAPPAPALLKHALQEAVEVEREWHWKRGGWCFISHHSLCITGAAP